MTAEIVIMNKKAVALAADSAVTIGDGERKYNTANKLFMLSKYHPVGIMLYNNADFMGIPWEIIIKDYRDALKRDFFDNISDYSMNFISHLTSEHLGLGNYEANYVLNNLYTYLAQLIADVESKSLILIEQTGSELTREQELNIMKITIEEHFNYFNTLESLENMSECSGYLIERYDSKLDQIRNELAENNKYEMSNESFEVFKQIFTFLFTKEHFWHSYSGIVITGFGKKCIFPALLSFKIEGIINGNVKYSIENNKAIDTEHDFEILPFAQTDVVDAFLRGLNFEYYQVIQDAYNSEIVSMVDSINDLGFDQNQKQYLKEQLGHKWRSFIDKLFEHSREKYYIPILKAVRSLPKEDLASMAESLVNLTSFKRQVAMDNNSGTVGGPIDVAVISRGDGFIWIKRKHYFEPKLNPHFFSNYYLNDREEESNNE
jgi:hypothetical protein